MSSQTESERDVRAEIIHEFERRIAMLREEHPAQLDALDHLALIVSGALMRHDSELIMRLAACSDRFGGWLDEQYRGIEPRSDVKNIFRGIWWTLDAGRRGIASDSPPLP